MITQIIISIQKVHLTNYTNAGCWKWRKKLYGHINMKLSSGWWYRQCWMLIPSLTADSYTATSNCIFTLRRKVKSPYKFFFLNCFRHWNRTSIYIRNKLFLSLGRRYAKSRPVQPTKSRSSTERNRSRWIQRWRQRVTSSFFTRVRLEYSTAWRRLANTLHDHCVEIDYQKSYIWLSSWKCT